MKCFDSRKLSVRFAIIFCLVTVNSVSANVVGMNSYQIPESIGVFPDGKIEVIFPVVFNSACEDGGGKRIYLQVGDQNNLTKDSIIQIQSVVLTAQLARKPIKFWYYRDGIVCKGGKVVVIN